MSTAHEPQEEPRAVTSQDNAIAVISAYGAFRLLLVLLAVWTFFAGFSLLTQGVGALSFGGGAAAERVLGGYLLILVPIYGLLAWRRDEYRFLIWVPYAAQVAIVVPTFYDLTISHQGHFGDSALILIVSLIFLALLVYLWWSSHPVHHFLGGEEDDEWDDDEGADDDDGTDAPAPRSPAGRPSPPDDQRRPMPPPV